MSDQIVNAEELNSLYREKHIDHPAEEAHPFLQELLYEHIDDRSAHNLPQRLERVIEKHKQDPNAHKNVVDAVARFLSDHSHPELAEAVDREIAQPLIEGHIQHGHARVRETLGKAYISDSPPPMEDTLPDYFLWYKPSENTLFLRYRGKWYPVAVPNPFTVNDKKLAAVIFLLMFPELFENPAGGMVEESIAEYLPWIDLPTLRALLATRGTLPDATWLSKIIYG